MSGILERLAGEGLAVEELAREGSDPLPVALPATEDQVRVVLDVATADGLQVVPSGRGSKLAWCRPEVGEGAGAVDLLLSTRRMDAVTDYVPGDGTLSAQAGCPMARMQETVAAGGHLLTPCVPHPEEATLGGVLGAGQSGPDRLRHGPLRHHVLGARVMLADGTAAKSGGRLVKNVTGFDLHRLYTGSRGTLGVLLEASLRLFPAPEERCTLTLAADDASGLFESAARLRELPASPLALTIENAGPDPGWHLHLFLAGLAPQVEWERGAGLEILGGGGGPAVRERVGPEAEAHFARVRDLEARGEVRLVARPSRIAAALATLVEGEGEGARVVVQPGVATAVVRLPRLGDADPRGQADLLGDLASRLAAREGAGGGGTRLEPLALPTAVHAALAPTGADAAGLGWMLSLRRELDPAGIFRSPTFPGRS